MTTADFTPCPPCTTPYACGMDRWRMEARCPADDRCCKLYYVSGEPCEGCAPDAQPEHYTTLRAILDEAYAQSAEGKGAERHANGRPWADQPINTITATVGPGFPAGQAIKKLTEAMGMLRRGEGEAARREVLGAIVYAAAVAHHIGDKP